MREGRAGQNSNRVLKSVRATAPQPLITTPVNNPDSSLPLPACHQPPKLVLQRESFWGDIAVGEASSSICLLLLLWVFSSFFLFCSCSFVSDVYFFFCIVLFPFPNFAPLSVIYFCSFYFISSFTFYPIIFSCLCFSYFCYSSTFSTLCLVLLLLLLFVLFYLPSSFFSYFCSS